MLPRRPDAHPAPDVIGCLVLSVAAVLVLAWFGWLLSGLTLESDDAGTGVGLMLVGFPSFTLALALARAQRSQKPMWFIGIFVALAGSSFLLMLLTVALLDWEVR